MNLTQQPLLYLAPDMFGPPSGIGRYCRLVGQTLHNAQVPVTVVALADQAPLPDQGAEWLPRGAYVPCGGSRLRFVRTAIQLTLQRRPQVILVGHVNFGALGVGLARLVGAKTVTFIYGIDVMLRLPQGRRWPLQRSPQVISISRFTAQQAATYNGLDADKIRILPNCLDPQFARQEQHGQPTDALSLLTVARLSLAEQYKGHDYVIRAMPALLARYPTLVYNIVGDGDGRPRLEQLATELGVRAAVHFHGRVTDTELLQRYAEASLFIMPSRAEGFGFVFLEAMAYGLPVIGGTVDATPEVVVDGKTGCLINPTSVEEITVAVDGLLRDPELRTQMGQAAKRHVAGQFDFHTFQARLLGYLNELNEHVPLGQQASV